MNQTLKTSLFQQAIEAVEALSLEDRAALIDTLSDRLAQHQRQQLAEEVRVVREEYQAGKVTFVSVNDFLSELDN